MTGPARKAISPLPMTLETVRKDHFVQRRLCNDLEALADRLPELPATPEVRALCDRIEMITTSHFERAETVLAALPDDRRPQMGALSTLHQMHQLDEVHAQDVVAALLRQADCHDPQQIGQLAYMLRCFFDGFRRLIALKESWISGAARDDAVTPR